MMEGLGVYRKRNDDAFFGAVQANGDLVSSYGYIFQGLYTFASKKLSLGASQFPAGQVAPVGFAAWVPADLARRAGLLSAALESIHAGADAAAAMAPAANAKEAQASFTAARDARSAAAQKAAEAYYRAAADVQGFEARGGTAIDGALRLRHGRLAAGFKGSRFAHDGNDAAKLVNRACFDGLLNERSLFCRPFLHGQNKWQGSFAFPQIVAEVFAHFGGIALVIQNIVNDLKSSAQGLTIVCASFFQLRRSLRQDGCQTRAGLKQFGGFRPNDVQIGGFV
jgi:hypothetical protein